jgi:hypothetical protein
VSAVRGVEPHQVLTAVGARLEGAGIPHARKSAADPQPGNLLVSHARDGWTTVTWPAYVVPPDLSRDLHTVVSTITTTDHEGWSHTLSGCGTLLDRFHSYPTALAWDADDAATLTREWSGDFELVARVLAAPACEVRRHFCQATASTPDHPGRERLGYLGLWRALGIRVADGAPYAALTVAVTWQPR